MRYSESAKDQRHFVRPSQSVEEQEKQEEKEYQEEDEDEASLVQGGARIADYREAQVSHETHQTPDGMTERHPTTTPASPISSSISPPRPYRLQDVSVFRCFI